jgi:hypothetical protein
VKLPAMAPKTNEVRILPSLEDTRARALRVKKDVEQGVLQSVDRWWAATHGSRRDAIKPALGQDVAA